MHHDPLLAVWKPDSFCREASVPSDGIRCAHDEPGKGCVVTGLTHYNVT